MPSWAFCQCLHPSFVVALLNKTLFIKRLIPEENRRPQDGRGQADVPAGRCSGCSISMAKPSLFNHFPLGAKQELTLF